LLGNVLFFTTEDTENGERRELSGARSPFRFYN
jgi:hypothetical protein